MLTLRASGLTIPWALVEYPVAVKAMKTALEQGANFWNGVRAAF
jgi:pyridoxine 4-dehydrogenase